SKSLVELVDAWSGFVDGENDRQTEEGGINDKGLKSNGRNAWDYLCQVRESRSELLLNCLGDQEGMVPTTDIDASCDPQET
ncbi:MAG: hypothetical protein WBM80_13760, partial [Woeseiaceae bacterium]